MNLNITDASGRSWFFTLLTDRFSTIGRAPDNDVVLFDPLVSRHHAFIKYEDGFFVLVDGVFVNGQIKRSANHILVNGTQCYERRLNHGDQITIGKSTLRFELRPDDSCNMAIPPSESIVLQAVNIPQKIHLEPISTLQA